MDRELMTVKLKASGWSINPAWLVWCDCGRFEGGHWAEQDKAGQSLCKWGQIRGGSHTDMKKSRKTLKSGDLGVNSDG